MKNERILTTAIHLLTALAYNADRLVNSEMLANSLQTNPGLVRRSVSILCKQGWVESIKGKNGGYRLCVAAKSISLRQVYEAINAGPLFHSFDKEPFAACQVSCNIGKVLSNVYSDLEKGLLVKMDEIYISDIVKKIG